ncbi:MAG TPA: TolC family protein [Nitrospiria bacterium]|nr:TolC family protein [Nitrospiria bacterium]
MLSLTLQECIERALGANLDLQIERVTPAISEWNIVSAEGAFDPALTGSINYQNSLEPLSPERKAALNRDSLKDQQLQTNLSLIGTLQTGTRYELSAFDTLSGGTLAPDGIHTGTTGLTLTQPLLKNFGRSNTVAVRVARSDRQIAIEQTAGRVMDIVSDVSRSYYELVFAIEDHAAKLEDLQRAKALLADNRTRVEVGVMSPLDVTQAEAGAAEREEAVIVAERAIIERENALKRLIASDVTTLRGVSLRPSESLPEDAVATDAAESTRIALTGRPEVKQARHEVERQSLLRAFNRNQALPEVNLETSYGLNARGDTPREWAHDLKDRNNPVWSVGLTATMPLGNRQADAAYRIARLEEERAGLTLRKLEQDIIVQVDNAVGRVRTNGKRVEATRVARRLAEESLKAEEARLRAGASTSFLVLQAQSQLAAARSAEIRAKADYGTSLVDLARVEGTTLAKHHITLDE